MSLEPGTRLGAYEILTLLGRGGMGEVYRARDVNLNRFVAIKVLPTASANAQDRRERFEREAQAVAALNHPNIVTIFSVEQADGHFFLTMELVEGRSLAEALLKGGLPLDKVLAIAIPLADAVAAAHNKGITHRDLKPANIMIGDGDHAGRIKVLDFGLAKLTEAPLAAAGVSAMPTLPITAEGRIVGTVAYMSPEQAEGKPIDARSDLFSLGVILYELATGVRPFTGDTSMSIISSILKDTPKSITELNPILPPDLGRIVRRALAKDPERRYQTAKDLRNDLEELKAQLDSGEVRAPIPAASGVPLPISKPAVTIPLSYALTASVVVLVGAMASYMWWPRQVQPSPAAAVAERRQDIQLTQLTTSGNAARPVLSPDGKYIAYIKGVDDFERGGSLWIRQVAGSSDVQIVAPEPMIRLWGLTITPDGNFVDYVRLQGPRMELWRVSFLGGVPKKIIDRVVTPVGWSADGHHMAFVRLGDAGGSSLELMVADADGENARVLATRRNPAMFHSLAQLGRPPIRPAWSTDGHWIALAGSLRSPALLQQLVIVDSSAGTERALSAPGTISGIEWLDADSLLVSQAVEGGPSQLWRIASNNGTVSRLTNDLTSYQGVSLDAAHDSVVTQRAERRVTVLTSDRVGDHVKEIVASTPSSGMTDYVGWAADRVLFTSTIAGHRAISIVAASGGPPQELAPFGSASAPKATSDGRTIVFSSLDPSHPGLWKVMDGGRPVQLTKDTALGIAVANGDRDVFFLSQSTSPTSAWTISIDGGTPRQIMDRAITNLALSPDGQTFAYVDRDEHGVREYVLCDLPNCSLARTIPITPVILLTSVQWTADGAALSYGTGTPTNVWIQPRDGKPPHQLTHFTDERPIADFAWSRDGKYLAIARTTTTYDIVLIKGLKR